MKGFASIKTLLYAMTAAMTCQAMVPCVPCRTFAPDPAALSERVASRLARKQTAPLLRATVSGEKLRNVVDVLVAFDLSAQKWLSENAKL